MMRSCSALLCCSLATFFCGLGLDSAIADEPIPEIVSFNRDVRPILSDNCFACHGPDANKREADLRLDVETNAESVIERGTPDDSELIVRVLHEDPEQRMPPQSSGKTLTERQIAILKKWIDQGAPWQKHWSLIPPQRPQPPSVQDEQWVINFVDRFVLHELERAGLHPSVEADKRTLIRRLYFDLIGMPPTPAEVDQFLADASPDAYERLVDRLLGSSHYGERMAIYWLDLVRYSDTAGYHSDNHRDVSPYRDYVINAFNSNLPFNQFTIDQLAGDLLPNATRDQRIASGYNRLLQTTEEGGAQPKEYTAKYAADRVRNTSVIWLGMTMGCCECHDHKYDPFTTREFYSMEAFFADISEIPVGRQPQTLVPFPDQQQQLEQLEGQLKAQQDELQKPSEELEKMQREWEATTREQILAAAKAWTPVRPETVTAQNGTGLSIQEDLSILSEGENPDKDTYVVELRPTTAPITGIRLEAITHDSFPNKSLSRANGNFVLSEFEMELVVGDQAPKPVKLAKAQADFAQAGFPIENAIDGKVETGWAVEGHAHAKNRTAVFVLAEPITAVDQAKIIVRLRHESIHAKHNIGHLRLSVTAEQHPSVDGSGDLPANVATALQAADAERTDQHRTDLKTHFRSIAPALAPVRETIAQLQKDRDALVATIPTTLVSTAVEPRVVRILKRGNWLDESGDVVEPTTPESLNPLKVEGRRANRLDLAEWMMADENPLTARVFVNRLWKLCFGYGISRTVEDLGTQGQWPTHPELLDWLAVEFRENGWNIKHIHKLLVMSRAYRQSSIGYAQLVEADPYNRLLGRQGRFRLEAELLRDNALTISGQLVDRVGGPSVKPYQPAGYWANLNFPVREWENDQGENAYRRGLYTYWCRTFLHPMMLAFDASSREECVGERTRSNTPLQSLVLLNDPAFVESARVFAERMMGEGGSTVDERIAYAYRQALQRAPRAEETALLGALYQKHLAEYQQDRDSAIALTKIGQDPVSESMDAAELAAWTSVARTILNLHETITRN